MYTAYVHPINNFIDYVCYSKLNVHAIALEMNCIRLSWLFDNCCSFVYDNNIQVIKFYWDSFFFLAQGESALNQLNIIMIMPVTAHKRLLN